MADEGLRFEAWTMPHVGTLTRRLDFTKLIESYSLNDRFNDLCDGVLTIPDDAALPSGALVKDKLLKVDEANHVNDVGSMVRVLRGETPILHYMVTRLEDSWSDRDPTTKVTLEGLEWLFDRATVPHYDHPADPTVDPDWIYGADTILANPGLEDSPQSVEVQFVSHTQTSGTFTLTYSAQTTTALAFNADWFAVGNALEALSNIQDVTVSGAGTLASPYVIEFIDPSGDAAQITCSATGANVGTYTAGGVLDPAGWTTSYNPSTGQPHGTYTAFNVTTAQANTGTHSLLVNAGAVLAGDDFPGVQQIVSVTPGRTYRAEVWVRPTFSATFRLVIRTLDETWIAESTGAGTPLTANVWTKLTIDPFVMPAWIDQVIFRVGLIDSTDRGIWYVDDGVLAPGFPPAPLGFIMNDLLTAAQAQGVLTWITPTWSTTLDSDGVAWDRDLKWNVNYDQTFLQLFEYARRWNYEFRIRWDNAQARFEWDMWNPLGGGQTRTVAVTGKDGGTGSGPIIKRPPDFTYMRVQGTQGRWGEHLSTTLDDTWGRLEKAQADRQGVESGELDELATRLVTRGQDRTGSRSIQVGDPTILPWTAYEPGDIVTLNLAPKDQKRALRIAACVVSKGPQDAAPTYEVHFVTPVLTNDAAISQGLRTLMREHKRQSIIAPSPRPATIPSCCPSCMAHASPEIVITSSSSSIVGNFDWTIEDDQEHLLALTANNDLLITTPGLYTVDFAFRFFVTFTAAGVAPIHFNANVDGNDAPNWEASYTAVSSGAFGAVVNVHGRFYAHTEASSKQISFGWEVEEAMTYPTTNLISKITLPTIGPNGTTNYKELGIVRHSPGCAEERFCS